MKEERNMAYKFREMLPEDNMAVAALIRFNLKKHGLDIPGTVYFDAGLDNLYDFYSQNSRRGYYVLTDEDECVIGGIGFAEFDSCPAFVRGMGRCYSFFSSSLFLTLISGIIERRLRKEKPWYVKFGGVHKWCK
jgi:hypothetical protein